MTTGATLCFAADLLPTSHAASSAGRQSTLQEVECDYMLAVLQQTDWVVDGPRGAAKVLGLHANTLRNRMKKRGIPRVSHQIR